MMGDPPPIPLAVFESYCFMRSTYSHRHVYHNESTTHQHDHAHPGISPGLYGVRSSEVTYHNYYQWVCLLLVLQAAICYTPWVYWKAVERGRVAKLVEKVSKDPLTEKPLRERVSLQLFLFFFVSHFLTSYRSQGWEIFLSTIPDGSTAAPSSWSYLSSCAWC